MTKNENTFIHYLKSVDYTKMFICFMLYAMIGWLYEVFLEVVIYQWGYSDRGVLFGPYCPVYGVGATIFVLAFYKYKKESASNPILKMVALFMGCMFIATLIELITSYILELLTGSWPWQTYVDYAINYQGRIALSPSIRFGLGGILFLYIIQPLFDKVLGKLQKKTINIIGGVLLVILVVDMIVTLCI